jgi:excisionase family DNA binding protein
VVKAQDREKALNALMTLAEVARELKCSRHHARHLIDSGRLPFVNIGITEKRIPRIPRDAFEKWMRDRTERTGTDGASD